jgi:hypothetical protein
MNMATNSKGYLNIACLSVFIVLATVLFLNTTGFVYGQDDSLPFEIGDISSAVSEDTNASTSSSNNSGSNSTNSEQNDQVINCDMPPCPPGQACIQSCPEVSVQ